MGTGHLKLRNDLSELDHGFPWDLATEMKTKYQTSNYSTMNSPTGRPKVFRFGTTYDNYLQ